MRDVAERYDLSTPVVYKSTKQINVYKARFAFNGMYCGYKEVILVLSYCLIECVGLLVKALSLFRRF